MAQILRPLEPYAVGKRASLLSFLNGFPLDNRVKNFGSDTASPPGVRHGLPCRSLPPLKLGYAPGSGLPPLSAFELVG
jgi:hypothetical protein